MNCLQFTNELDEYLAGALARAEHDAAAAHLNGCRACQRLVAGAQARRATLRNLPIPAPRAGFFDEALRHAQRAHQVTHRRWPQLTGLALAASLALWLGAGWLPQLLRAPDKNGGIVIALHEVRTVQLAFNADHELRQATLSITLPESVELQGFPGQREVRWQTDLARGVNVLSLPLVAVAAADGVLLARVQLGDHSSELTVPLHVNLPAPTSALPWTSATLETTEIKDMPDA